MYRSGVSLIEISNAYKISLNSLEKILKSQGINLDRDMDPVTKIKKSKIISPSENVRSMTLESSEVEEEINITPTMTITDAEKSETIVYKSEYDGVSIDQLNKIIEIMSSGSFNMTKISKEMDVPYESLRKIKSDLGLKVSRPRKNKEDNVDNKEIELVEEKVEEETESSQYIGCRRIYPGKYGDTIKVGLVRNRHDMPTCVKEYIFNKINNDDLANFSKLDSYVSAFILDKVKIKNGKACKNLQVFATGLQSALGSVVKMCYKNKVNLTLKHYDPVSKRYYDQIIFNDFEIDESDMIDFGGIEQIYVHNNMTEEELLNEEFYAIEAEIADTTRQDRKFKILHAFMNYDEAKSDYWERTMPSEEKSDDDAIGYKFYKAFVVDGKMVQTKFIHKSSRKE